MANGSVATGTSAYDTVLERILEEEGRRQSWLAERTGIHPSRLNHIVHGLRPREDEASGIADALGRNVEELWPA